MQDLLLSRIYQLVESGPVVLLTTELNGRANVMTMSWRMLVAFETPLVACIESQADNSYAALPATKECVMAIPAALAAKITARRTSVRADWESTRLSG